MADLEAEIQEFDHVLNAELIKDINCFVTEERIRRPTTHSLEGKENEPQIGLPEIDFSHDDDYYRVIEEGSLEGLRDNLRYRYGETADIIELVSYVIQYIASRQIFGNGNKRTSFVVGYLVLFFYQLNRDYEEISLPALTDDFVDMIANVANENKEEDQEDIKNFLEGMRKHIVQSSD